MNNFHQFSNGVWAHRPPWKVAINKTLRALQFWTSDPFVVASICEMESGIPARCVGYSIRRMGAL